MSEKKIFSIDRAEGELFVCISDDDEKLVVPRSCLEGLKVNDLFSAELCGEKLLNVTPMPEERDRRIERNRARLHALSNRKKQ